MNKKPKDRTSKWMNIVAIILVLINAFGPLIYGFTTGEFEDTVIWAFIFIIFLVIALRWKVVGGACFILFGLIAIVFGFINILSGHYENLTDEVAGLIWGGIMPFVAGFLFLIIWRRRRKNKVPIMIK